MNAAINFKEWSGRVVQAKKRILSLIGHILYQQTASNNCFGFLPFLLYGVFSWLKIAATII